MSKKSNKRTTSLTIILIIAIFVNISIAVIIYQYKAELNNLITQNSNEVSFDFSEINKLEEKGCPDAIAGNKESVFNIKYFYSDFCAWCKKQDPILKQLLKEKGNLFSLEFFNIDNCEKEFIQYGAIRVPTLILKVNGFDEIIHPSFVYKKDLENLICKANDGC
ncbi:MAG: thioredoxin family protein [Nanoarchaeota archaeon]|nr:thioredoxin family protein [Nanoarchaeota archaeon]